jgi:hypothetical protein
MIRKLLGTAVLALGLTLAGCGQDINNQYGTLKLTIEGLPAGQKAAVKVKGTNIAFEKTLEASSELQLLADTYGITASPVKVAGVDYDFTVSAPSIKVNAKAVSESKVTFAKASTITVTINGLPSGVNARVVVTGPNGFEETVDATKTLTFIKPGNYTVTAPVVISGVDSYGGTVTPAAITVANSEDKTSVVNFTKVDTTIKGSINLDITGLKAGVNPKVNVTGPDGFSQQIVTSGAVTLADLKTGTYTITAEEVDSDTFATDFLVFVPEQQTTAVSVVGASPVSATVKYGEQFSYASFDAPSFGKDNNVLKQGGYFYTYTDGAGSSASFTRDNTSAAVTFVNNNNYYLFDIRPIGDNGQNAGNPQNLSAYSKMRLKLGSLEGVSSINITAISSTNGNDYKDAQYTVTGITSDFKEYVINLSDFKAQGGLEIDAVKSAWRQLRIVANGGRGKYQVGNIYLIK